MAALLRTFPASREPAFRSNPDPISARPRLFSCEKNKFDAGSQFAIDFIDMASSRFSPQADALKKLHIKAAENRGASAT